MYLTNYTALFCASVLFTGSVFASENRTAPSLKTSEAQNANVSLRGSGHNSLKRSRSDSENEPLAKKYRKNAADYYQDEAKKGCPRSQYNLAELYCNERLGNDSTDFDKAGFWYAKAAEQGHREAQYNLGLLYAQGLYDCLKIDSPDYIKAGYWLTKAAEQGSGDAQFYLAMELYDTGLYKVEWKDYSINGTIKDWLTQAANQGNKDAQDSLKELFEDDCGHLGAPFHTSSSQEPNNIPILTGRSSYNYGSNMYNSNRQQPNFAGSQYNRPASRGVIDSNPIPPRFNNTSNRQQPNFAGGQYSMPSSGSSIYGNNPIPPRFNNTSNRLRQNLAGGQYDMSVSRGVIDSNSPIPGASMYTSNRQQSNFAGGQYSMPVSRGVIDSNSPILGANMYTSNHQQPNLAGGQYNNGFYDNSPIPGANMYTSNRQRSNFAAGQYSMPASRSVIDGNNPIPGIGLSTLMDRSINQGPVSNNCKSSPFDIPENQNLIDVEDYMRTILRNTLPEKVLLILDVDGTLTNYSIPGNHETKARGNAVQFVKDMVNEGVKVVVSSAWNNIEETLGRLNEIGLLEILNASTGAVTSGENDFGLGCTFQYCYSGLVSSMMDPNTDKKYYRQKAFSYINAYKDLDTTEITHVVFADDSKRNIKYFEEDLFGTDLFDKADIRTFKLSQVDGGEDLE